MRTPISEFFTIARNDPGRPKKDRALAPGTVIRRTFALDKLAGHLHTAGVECVEDLRTQHFIDPAFTRRDIQAISRAVSYVAEVLELDLPKVRIPPAPRRLGRERREVREKAFSISEVERILQAAGGPLGAVCFVLNETGIRPGELLAEPFQYQTPGLRWPQVDLDAGLIEVDGKTGVREIVASGGLLEMLRGMHERAVGQNVIEHPDGSPVTQNAMCQALRRLLVRLGIPHRPLYGFRHGFALRMADTGCPIHWLKELMGHADIKTTDIYLSPNLRNYAGEIRDLMARC